MTRDQRLYCPFDFLGMCSLDQTTGKRISCEDTFARNVACDYTDKTQCPAREKHAPVSATPLLRPGCIADVKGVDAMIRVREDSIAHHELEIMIRQDKIGIARHEIEKIRSGELK